MSKTRIGTYDCLYQSALLGRMVSFEMRGVDQKFNQFVEPQEMAVSYLQTGSFDG